MIVNPENFPVLKEALGEHLYALLVNLERRTYSSIKNIHSARKPSYIVKLLGTSALSYTFLWFAMISNHKKGHPDKTSPYQTCDYQLAHPKLPESIKSFVELSDRIEYW